uniref:Uncharacterized protein n=1 Tax=Pithovirus LCPAC101 TaxID=2506586 RepID=A0A481Z314_9VIRU|nr:MAG: hypothetical protein LCPAC101_01170 [Pithovirus LCPAC101]
MSEGLSIYLVSAAEWRGCGYDTYDSFVVVAPNTTIALSTYPGGSNVSPDEDLYESLDEESDELSDEEPYVPRDWPPPGEIDSLTITKIGNVSDEFYESIKAEYEKEIERGHGYVVTSSYTSG